ncbi:polymer-forming cytoskeletal protein [Patescibacteria group bacterium]|nr:polymer-forming cytoskeletal protein [Patescibacteria group bacterium]
MFGTKPTDGNVFTVGKGEGDHLSATLIARGVRVEGEFTSQGDVVIEGEVSGTLNCTGMLTIGVEAKIKADIKANDVIIAGIVEGNIVAARKLEVKSGGKVTGDVTCEVIVIEGGASMNGRVSSGKRLVEVQPATGKRTERAQAAV